MRHNPKILAHYQQLRNMGTLDKAASNVGAAQLGSIACGDVMQIHIQVNQQQQISQAKYKVYGCGYAIACCSWLVEHIQNKSLSELHTLSHECLVEALALPPQKLHCAILACDALHAALENYQAKCQAHNA